MNQFTSALILAASITGPAGALLAKVSGPLPSTQRSDERIRGTRINGVLYFDTLPSYRQSPQRHIVR